ncbi:hypothetical protein AB6A40_008647 [Gnathostoma spinigerum]|uniref:PBC domain-containing protein n=1 Tax=Gnathostoma spinigerum TaxID=75299 RepID=A0ABD6EPQ6_9BILA
MGDVTASNSLNDLLSQLMNISEQTLDDHTQQRKQQLQTHRMKHALFDVLCEVKEKTGGFNIYEYKMLLSAIGVTTILLTFCSS